MSQSLELNLKTTSDVPQAVEKAKQAVTGFSKQVDEVNKKTNQTAKQETAKTGGQLEDIQKKFATSFKDIFLSLLGPIVLLNKALELITDKIEKSKQESKELREFSATSDSPYLDPKTKYLANLRVATDRERMERGMAPKATNEEYAYFLMNDPRSKEVQGSAGFTANVKALFAGLFSSGDEGAAKSLAANESVKEAIDKVIEKAAANATNRDKKPPEGFSNVIGVGPNPVMEAMNLQLEEAQKQTALLEKIANPAGGVQTDFTKKPESK